MRFAFFLLVFSQTLFTASAMVYTADIGNRGPSNVTTYYKIFPDELAGANQTKTIQTVLVNLCGVQNVTPHTADTESGNQKIDFWTVVSTNLENSRTQLSSVDGVRKVELLESPKPRHDRLDRRDAGSYYALAAENSDLQKTEEWLKSKVDGIILQMKSNGAVIGWSNLTLTTTAKEEVEKYEGIRLVHVNANIVEFGVISASSWSHTPSVELHKAHRATEKLFTRDEKWEKQTGADKALVMNSQYPGADLNKLTDFVHIAEPGKGSSIYIVERGIHVASVNPDVAYEFRPPSGNPENILVLQTAGSEARNQDKSEDDSRSPSHGTYVASKALGSKFGVAKQIEEKLPFGSKATLISVKFAGDEADLGRALHLILDHVQKNRNRLDRSVILITSGSEDTMTHDQAKADSGWTNIFEHPISNLLALGVPIVCASGNYADDPKRQNIDTRPQVYQDEDTPIINVGAADYEGKRYIKSQGGSQLTVFGPGVSVSGMQKKDLEWMISSGTSVASAQVAGLIATYLSHESTSKHWSDKSGVDRVKAIRDYLVSDDSSWARSGESRMIWNGATKEAHESAGTNINLPPPTSQVPPPPPTKTRALSIIIENNRIDGINDNAWLFYSTPYGKSVICDFKAPKLLSVEGPGGSAFIDEFKWPGGAYKFKVENMDCEYKNSGTNPGALWCSGRSGPIECQGDIMMGKDVKAVDCASGVSQRGVVVCEW